MNFHISSFMYMYIVSGTYLSGTYKACCNHFGNTIHEVFGLLYNGINLKE